MRRKALGLSGQAFVLSLVRAVGQLIMVAVLAVVARQVGVDRYGLLASAFAAAALLAGIIDFGAGSYWVREYSSGRMSPAELQARSSGKICAGLLAALALIFLGSLFPSTRFLSLGGGLLAASTLTQTLQGLLIATRQNARLSLAALIERLVLAGAFLALTAAGAVAPEVAFVIAYISGSVAFVSYAWVPLREVRPSFRNISWQRTWAGAGYYGFSTCLISLQSADVLIGGAVGGQGAVGAYGAVARWTMPITLATQSFSTLLNPVASAAEGRHALWRVLRRSVWLPGVSMLVAVAVALLAGPIVPLILGDGFEESIPVLQFMALAAALSSVAQTAFTVLQARRRERIVALALATSVSTQLLLVAPLVVLFGATGLAVAAATGQCVLCLILGLAVCAILIRR